MDKLITSDMSHINNLGYAIVTLNPNAIETLQEGHDIRLAVSNSGDGVWAFKENNEAGQKWVLLTDNLQNIKDLGMPDGYAPLDIMAKVPVDNMYSSKETFELGNGDDATLSLEHGMDSAILDITVYNAFTWEQVEVLHKIISPAEVKFYFTTVPLNKEYIVIIDKQLTNIQPV